MENKKFIRILIADDHSLFRNGIMSMFSENTDILIVGEAPNGHQVISQYTELKPDVVLLDISMPDMNGFETLKKLLEIDKKARVLFLSMYDSEEYIFNTLKAGGLGLINKDVLKGELIFAINKVANGQFYFGQKWDSESLNNLLQHHKRSEEQNVSTSYELLTTREKEIVKLIALGLTSSQIADRLFIGKRTVDFHRSIIMQKMNVKTLPELIKFSIDFSSGTKNSH